MREEAAVEAPAFVRELRGAEGVVAVELRPPPADLPPEEGMDAWIDMHHSVGRLARRGRYVLLTDDAVGSAEEENLDHLASNLAEGADPGHVVPFLTCKHSLEYCLVYAERASAQGFGAITVVGGDRDVGPPRCVPHAAELRARIRERVPGLALGGWANPHRDAEEQVGWLVDARDRTDYVLTQVVSHHSAGRVEALLRERERQGLDVPVVFGVFHYRSAKPETLGMLDDFFPVPAEAITREFEEGVPPEEITARAIRAIRAAGGEHVYVSNLGTRRTAARLAEVLERV